MCFSLFIPVWNSKESKTWRHVINTRRAVWRSYVIRKEPFLFPFSIQAVLQVFTVSSKIFQDLLLLPPGE